jgi:hypothetical protein
MLRIEPQKTGVGVGVPPDPFAPPIFDRVVQYTAAVSKISGGFPSKKLGGSVVKKLGRGHD